MALTQLGLGGYSQRRYGTFGASASALGVYHESRKALETRLATATALSTLTIGWPNRPVTVPASASWLRVHGIRWLQGNPATIGPANAASRGLRYGEFVVEVIGPANTGFGPLNDIADSIRDRFNRQNLSVPSGMHLWCLAPSGPTPEVSQGFARVSVRIPFMVSETVTN